VDLEGAPEIPADLQHVVDTELGTSLGVGDVRVLTVEHVLASLAAHGVDNAVLELEGPEPPIRDGSFKDYFAALTEAGVEEQDAECAVIRVREPFTVQEGNGEMYVVTPAPEYRISASIDFEHPAIGRQFGTFPLSTDLFRETIAPARTFGFRADGEALQARGLALGASLDNTVVLDDDGVLNDGLRFPDEFLRHKVGDIVGDLGLLGGRIEGHVVAERPSHRGNVALARALAEHERRGDGTPIVDAQKIMEYLPHRYPMLLVDRIIDFESGKRIVGIKNVTVNEPFFQGHYPEHPIMPGVLIIEAMAQVGGLLLMDAVEDPKSKVVYFMTLDNVKWRRPVTPGDQIVFELEMLQLRRHVCKMRGIGRVDGHVVAEAELMARIMDR
jgi:UDP-3-O-[3-hydroxymyristoyl] N-acetylglucosamine deacetylase/3-hydroxyacyl-[acyl-carrier-protein] dehydratase